MRRRPGFVFTLALAFATAAATEAPSRPGVDAPELARLGSFAVGIRTIDLVDSARQDRLLKVDLWYPAEAAADARPETYAGSLPSEPPAPPAPFTIPGIAARDAQPAAGRFPLVIVSHGYSNETVAMSWLTENLASKGYVVAAIRHADPPLTDRSRIGEPLLHRPLDIAFVARELQRTLADAGSVDASRTALLGYSMGGYGVLTSAGATLDPAGPLAGMTSRELFASDARVTGLRAVVGISPAGGSLRAWGPDGLAAITAPMLLIAGDRDGTVDYRTGARAFFDQAVNARRYLLTFRGAGHNLGLGPAPAEMRERLWDQDWFEDPVWRKERIVGINLHFITAFLDRYVKDDPSRAAYLDGLVGDSTAGDWPAAAARAYGAYSPGGEGITVWKGFQRRHAEGLEWREAEPIRRE